MNKSGMPERIKTPHNIKLDNFILHSNMNGAS